MKSARKSSTKKRGHRNTPEPPQNGKTGSPGQSEAHLHHYERGAAPEPFGNRGPGPGGESPLLPHCLPYPQHLILYGPPGVGKTTAARLVLDEAKKLSYTAFGENAPFVECDGTTLRWDERDITNPSSVPSTTPSTRAPAASWRTTAYRNRSQALSPKPMAASSSSMKSANWTP